MAKGQRSRRPRRFVECHRTNGDEILIDVDAIIAAEEIAGNQMRMYCACGHTFEISQKEYRELEDVINYEIL